MKINSTVALTLALLTLMAVAGGVSAMLGNTMGREALKGVTQPDTRPTNNLTNSRKGKSPQKELVILKEEEIIATVKARISGSPKEGKRPAPAASPQPKTAAAAKPAQFPLSSQNQGVVLEISSAVRQGDDLVLNVNLRNTGKQPVRFLYSFLNVTDEQGQALSATTDGLPAELPSESEPFTGTISIPATLLNNTKTLALSLSDYPDQAVKLQIPNIPVAR